MKALEFINDLGKNGRHYFTIVEAVTHFAKPKQLVQASLRRLVKKGYLTTPHQGFYLIIPSKYRSLGCLPAEQFIPELMQYLDLPYYVGLLSAAQYYGAAHQKPQQFQVVTKNYFPSINCGRVNVTFVMNQGISHVPTQQLNTETGYISLSTPEATAIDLFQYPRRSGGINNIITVLMELVESINAKQLKHCLSSMQVELVTKQRLGYCLDFIEHDELSEVVFSHLSAMNLRTRPLVAGISTRQSERNKKWELFINANLEPDL